jgi:PhoH-like ATPase
MPLPPAPTSRAARLNTEGLPTAATPAKKTRSKAAAAPAPDTAQALAGPVSAMPATPALVAAAPSTASAATTAAAHNLAQLRKQPAPAAPATPAATPTASPGLATTKSTTKSAPAKTPRRATPAVPATAQAVAAPRLPHKRSKRGENRCLFVLDTNVLLHDPSCVFRFQEHDVFLPLMVLEELDSHKRGSTEVARNGRQVSRTLDTLVEAQKDTDLAAGLKLDASGNKGSTGQLFFQTAPLPYTLPINLPQGKADNQILGVVQALRAQETLGREVILVSKDINMRVKARALGLPAEDYRNDKVLDDDDLLYTGALALPADVWRKAKDVRSWQEGGSSFYSLRGALTAQMLINQFVYFEAPGEPSLYTRVVELRGDTVVLEVLRDHTSAKHNVWGVTARNREQNFALNLLMDPEVDVVTLTGQAGTGKTLLALAAGLTQVLDARRYSEIIMTRATVSVGEDIGFLPGTEEEKMGPWMGALDDNLEFLAKGEGGNPHEWGRSATNELIRSRIKIKSLNFMRGRTFLNKFVIIDEAQNLTPKQMKTLITRAGPGTKIICMGNLAQIDTPYLTEGSSGLTYVVDRFKGWQHGGHIQLARGERSRLADFASEVL